MLTYKSSLISPPLSLLPLTMSLFLFPLIFASLFPTSPLPHSTAQLLFCHHQSCCLLPWAIAVFCLTSLWKTWALLLIFPSATLFFFFFLTKWAENHSFFPLDKADIRQVHLFSLQDWWQRDCMGTLNLHPTLQQSWQLKKWPHCNCFFKITEEIQLGVCILNTITLT